jgi:hypothetical protein
MPVKSKSRTFKPGEDWDTVLDLITENSDDAFIFEGDETLWFDQEIKVKKHLVITIKYERDESKIN